MVSHLAWDARIETGFVSVYGVWVLSCLVWDVRMETNK